VGDSHLVRRIEELDNALISTSGLGGGRAKSTMGLGCRELLSLGHRGTWSLDASMKYGTITMPSWFPAAGEGDEEDVDVDVDSVDEGSRGGWQARL
jgi:hypothetical protein